MYNKYNIVTACPDYFPLQIIISLESNHAHMYSMVMSSCLHFIILQWHKFVTLKVKYSVIYEISVYAKTEKCSN